MSTIQAEINTYVDTYGAEGMTAESMGILLQPHVVKVMYVEEGVLYAVTATEWRAMWANKLVQLSGVLAGMWQISEGRREIWVFTPAAVNAATGASTLTTD